LIPADLLKLVMQFVPRPKEIGPPSANVKEEKTPWEAMWEEMARRQEFASRMAALQEEAKRREEAERVRRLISQVPWLVGQSSFGV
jgi:hypothetical protein